MSDFETYMRQHEMGQAYKAITAKMGPSPQLIAFVNNGDGSIDTVGLESFDFMSQHEAILAEIDSNNALGLAVESLEGKIHRIALKTKEGGWAAFIGSMFALFFVSGKTASVVSKIGGIGILAILGGHITKAVTEPEATLEKPSKYFYSYRAFAYTTAAFEEAYKLDLELVTSIPKSFNAEDWKLYNKRINGSKFYQFLFGNREERLPHTLFAKTSAAASGWTTSNFVDGVKWLKHNTEVIEKLREEYAKDLDRVDRWIKTSDKTDPNNHEVMKQIDQTIGVVARGFDHSVSSLQRAKQILDEAGQLFEEKK